MNSEVARLETFTSWPSNVPVRLLARSGFYATGNPMEAQCHWCKKKLAGWNPGDKVSSRHRQLDPLCPLLQNPALAGNVPIVTSSSSDTTSRSTVSLQSNENNGPNYRNEMTRLATFKNWPNPNVTPESLAKAGFYYFNDLDKVICAWCQGIIAEWEIGDIVFEEHKRFFPACPLVLFGPRIEVANNDRCDIGIQQFKAPKKPMYACLSARLRTYENWPRRDIQKPENLAQAGFYYQSIGDQVRCFHCNGGLRSWRIDDEPWIEHAKWFPHCHYVQLAKGKAFIDEVLKQKQSVHATSTVRNAQECFENAMSMSLDDAMTTEPVYLALQMGLNEGRIRNATKRRLECIGKPYETAEELVDAVLEGQVEEEDNDEGTEESTSMVGEVSRLLDSIFHSRYPSNNEQSYNSSFYDDESISNGSNTNHRTQDNPTIFESPTNRPNSTNPNVVPDYNSHKSSTANSDNSNDSSPDSMEAPIKLLRQITLEEENRKLKDARLCKICMDDEFGVVFLPCGHLVACVQCAPGIDLCPMCRTPIKGFVRTFLS